MRVSVAGCSSTHTIVSIVSPQPKLYEDQLEWRVKTYHPTSLIPRIYHMRQRQNAGDPRGDIGPIVAATVGMVQLADQLKFAPAAADDLGPDVDHAARVPGQDELALQPFVVRALVEDTGKDAVLVGFANRLVEEDRAVQRIQRDSAAAADHDVSRHVVDSGTLDKS